MKMPFHRVPIGAKFTFLGREYTKKGLSMADDENRNGNIFQYHYEVESEAMDPDPQAGFPKWEGFEERQRLRGLRIKSRGRSNDAPSEDSED